MFCACRAETDTAECDAVKHEESLSGKTKEHLQQLVGFEVRQVSQSACVCVCAEVQADR